MIQELESIKSFPNHRNAKVSLQQQTGTVNWVAGGQNERQRIKLLGWRKTCRRGFPIRLKPMRKLLRESRKRKCTLRPKELKAWHRTLAILWPLVRRRWNLGHHIHENWEKPNMALDCMKLVQNQKTQVCYNWEAATSSCHCLTLFPKQSREVHIRLCREVPFKLHSQLFMQFRPGKWKDGSASWKSCSEFAGNTTRCTLWSNTGKKAK